MRTAHSSMVRLVVALAGVCGGMFGGVCVAQESNPAALQGPKVTSESPAVMTLVSRDFDGRLVRLESRPEVAAMPLLNLAPEELVRAQEVLAMRATGVAELLANHYALFAKIQNARQGGAAEELRPLLTEFRPLAIKFIDPPLVKQVADVLPAASQERYTALVGEYLQALQEEEAANGNRGSGNGRPANMPGTNMPGANKDEMKGGDDAATDRKTNGETKERAGGPDRAGRGGNAGGWNRGREAAARVEMGLLLREMAQSLQSRVKERQERTEEMVKTLNLTTEQEAKVRAILRARGEESGLRPTAESRRAMMEAIMAELTPEQRRLAKGLRSK